MPKTIELLDNLNARGCKVILANDHYVPKVEGEQAWSGDKGWWCKIEGKLGGVELTVDLTKHTLDEAVQQAYYKFMGFAAHGDHRMAALTYAGTPVEEDA